MHGCKTFNMYNIEYQPEAKADLQRLKKEDPSAFKKAVKLLNELAEHPKTGTGHPEPLKADRIGCWSRRITKKHRLVYRIQDEVVTVLVLASYGHYDDK